ncbi:unnamed protein product [Lampetra planeri]
MSGSLCKSLYPFGGEQHQQGLSFQAGELIEVVQALPGGWWEGEKDGARGWFPSSYVQVLEGKQTSIIIAAVLSCSSHDVHQSPRLEVTEFTKELRPVLLSAALNKQLHSSQIQRVRQNLRLPGTSQ